MKRSSYREQDHAFGQQMLTLRAAIGLTQAGLADVLGVSRHAIGAWEAGQSYPKAHHLKHLIKLGIEQKAFAAGYEAEETRALWRAAHQKVLFDEVWLQKVLHGQAVISQPTTQPSSGSVTSAPVAELAEENIRGSVSVQSVSLRAVGAVDQWEEQEPVVRTTLQVPVMLSPPADIEPSTTGNQNIVLGMPFLPTACIGRDMELTEIARRLADPACRLLTLLGPGGMGKTRLALEVAVAHTTIFADGVAFVALASVNTPNQIASAISAALNLTFDGQSDPTAQLLSFLRQRHMLLVLDNFEHLLDGVDLVTAILAQAPRIMLLVTSRERLSLQAEWLFTIDGLAYPLEEAVGSDASHTPTNSADYSAVELFVQRATQVQPKLPFPRATLATIGRVCRQVAGMPLAIELAAAGVRSVSVDEIEQQIRSNLDVLATTLRDIPARHRSMRAVFDHSWNLLSEPERMLFTRLAVFRGGFNAEAAAQVAGATFTTLATLVNKSLLRRNSAQTLKTANRAASNANTELRFALLEPIREYALEQLAARPDAESIWRRHAHYFTTLAEAVAEQWDGPTAATAIAHLDREYDNIRAALQWTRDGGDVTVGLQLGTALRRFWQRRGYYREGRVWLEELLALDDASSDAVVSVRMRALHTAAWLAADQHDFARSAQLFEQSMALRRVLGETANDVHLLLNAARQARVEGRYQRAVALFEEALAQHRSAGNRGSASSGGLGQSLYDLALVYREQGHFAQAVTLLQEGLAFHREIGEREGEVIGLLGLGDVARDQGHAVQVRAYTEQSLAISREMGIQWAIGFSLNNLALAAYLEGNLTRARALADESLLLFRSLQADGSIAEVHVTFGHIFRAQGNIAEAHAALLEALRLAAAVGPQLMVATALEGLGSLTVQAGQAISAVQFLATAAALREKMSTPVRPMDQAVVMDALAAARSVLGADSFAAEWMAARDVSLDQLLRTASTSVHGTARGVVRKGDV